MLTNNVACTHIILAHTCKSGVCKSIVMISHDRAQQSSCYLWVMIEVVDNWDAAVSHVMWLVSPPFSINIHVLAWIDSY